MLKAVPIKKIWSNQEKSFLVQLTGWVFAFHSQAINNIGLALAQRVVETQRFWSAKESFGSLNSAKCNSFKKLKPNKPQRSTLSNSVIAKIDQDIYFTDRTVWRTCVQAIVGVGRDSREYHGRASKHTNGSGKRSTCHFHWRHR